MLKMKIGGNAGIRHSVNRNSSLRRGLIQRFASNSPILLLLLLLAGCGPMGKMAGLSESDLRAEIAECHSIASKSNSKTIGCQNFIHECEKRVKADGSYRSC